MSRKRRTSADEPFVVVRTSAVGLSREAVITTHRHPWHQMVYVSAGLAVVTTPSGTWMAPPTWGVWVPAGHGHGIRFAAGSALRTIYVRPDRGSDLAAGCRTCPVSPLLRELLLRAVASGMLDERDRTEEAITRLIIAELLAGLADVAGPPPFTLPQPTSRGMLALVHALERDLQGATALALARTLGLSVRTLERRFADETGLPLGRWRQQRALLRGLEGVATGASIKSASAAAGYRSPSAFIAAFRKAFGTSPGLYFRRSAQAE